MLENKHKAIRFVTKMYEGGCGDVFPERNSYVGKIEDR